MTTNQTITLVKVAVAALAVIPVFTGWTQAQASAWSGMLLAINMAFGQMQSNLDPLTKNFQPSAKD